MNKYKCGECGLAVIVLEGEVPIKACKCEAPIVAEMEGNATGIGGVEVK